MSAHEGDAQAVRRPWHVYLLFRYGSPRDVLVAVFATEELAWAYVEEHGGGWDGASVEITEVKEQV